MSNTQLLYLDFWADFDEFLKMRGAKGWYTPNRKPHTKNFMPYSSGRRGFTWSAVLRPRNEIMANLYLTTPSKRDTIKSAKSAFHFLEEDKSAIAHEWAGKSNLDWEELPSGQDCRISVSAKRNDLEDRKDWPNQHKWLAIHLDALHDAFADRIRKLQ